MKKCFHFLVSQSCVEMTVVVGVIYTAELFGITLDLVTLNKSVRNSRLNSKRQPWAMFNLFFFPRCSDLSRRGIYRFISKYCTVYTLYFDSGFRKGACWVCCTWNLLDPCPLGLLLVSQYGGRVTVMWAFPRFGHTHIQNPSDMGIPYNPDPNPNPNR